MTAQKRETGKNYIGLLSEETAEQQATDVSSAGAHRVKNYVIGLMSAVLNRRGEAR